MILIARRGMWVIVDGQQIGIIEEPLTFPDEAERASARSKKEGSAFVFTTRPRLTREERALLMKHPKAKVALVAPDGTTFETLYGVSYERLAQATWEQIPDNRRPARVWQIVQQGYLKADAALEE